MLQDFSYSLVRTTVAALFFSLLINACALQYSSRTDGCFRILLLSLHLVPVTLAAPVQGFGLHFTFPRIHPHEVA